jgi:3-oxoacyl-[acyl-carrier-protein] synthase III
MGSSLGIEVGDGLCDGSGEAESETEGEGSGVAVEVISLTGEGVSSSAIVGASLKITKVKAKIRSKRIDKVILRTTRSEKLRSTVLSIRSMIRCSNMCKYYPVHRACSRASFALAMRQSPND